MKRLTRAGTIVFLLFAAAASAAAPASSEKPLEASASLPMPAPGWVESVSEEIRKAEYEFSPQADASWSAPNRVHDLRTRVEASGVQIVGRTLGALQFDLRLALVGYGRDGAGAATIGPGRTTAVRERVELERDELTEWFVNQPQGLEHGFTLNRAPAVDPASVERGNAFLTLKLDGSVLLFPEGQDGRSVVFRDAAGRALLRYGGLRVTDAGGAELPARLVPASEQIRIEFDDRDAVYPVTVDPLLTLAVWTAESNQDNATFGVSVAAAGDVNGDGFSDLIVGAERYDNGEADEGRAYLYAGSAAGPSVSPAWTAESNQAGASFGKTVATAGDVNADGFADVLVGAWLYDNGQLDEGRVFLFLGSASGLNAAPAWTAESDQADARFAYSISSAGDVNGDGFSDILVGAWFYDNGQTDEGRAYVYHGSATAPAAAASWTVESDQAMANLGTSVAAAGDVNGDGFADVILGARNYDNGQTDEGRAFVYHGSATGLRPTPAWTAEPNQTFAGFGISVSGAGDVNGDGYADVIVGSHTYENGGTQTNEGRAWVYHGSATGLATTAAWTAEPNQAVANFGISVACAGDVNGDGFADVVVGSWFEDNGESDEGRAYLYQGSPAGLGLAPAWTAESNQVSAGFGVSVAGLGDVNGDGFGDVAVGAHQYDSPEPDEGRAYVYLGTAAGLSTTAVWRGEPDLAGAVFGTSVASAGDVNGDGFSDVIVGAPNFDNGEPSEGRTFVYLGSSLGLPATASWTAEPNVVDARFGTAVSSAGDVNGDGYSDVLIGAPRTSNGESLEGRAYVYAGGAAGLAAAPSWTFEPDLADALAGSSVARAGDLNGDGFADVVVGAPGFANGQTEEGAAYAFLGSPAGLGVAPAWRTESDQAGARLGATVASAGDVQLDGFSDLIVGAPLFDGPDVDEGRVFLYAGSAAGPASSATWVREANQAGAEYGFSVASGGDVNSDGFADVLVGARLYDNGSSDEGAAFLYTGSGAGPSVAPVWSIEANQDIAVLGHSVASAGDVNGDGFGDVVVGSIAFDNVQFDEGKAFLFLGSAGGLGSVPAWAVEPNQNASALGFCVASAGDVNGDGYSDVIVGAPFIDNGQADEGSAFLYYGNDPGGAPRIPRQARADGTAPIAILGSSESQSAFQIRQLGRIGSGRTRIRLEMEIKSLGNPLDGSFPLFSPVQVLTPGPSAFFPFVETISGLTPGTPYAWRARVRSSEPLFPRSPWFGMPDNGIKLIDFRASCGAQTTWYRDADDDGWGNPGVTLAACLQPAGYVTQFPDCDDGSAARFPGAAETCNGFDDDCDSSVDEGFGQTTCGVGACERTVNNCAGGVPQSCVPGASSPETCNSIDDDCNGAADDLPAISCGVGACQRTVAACAGGAPQTCTPGTPEAETCNLADDDCNGAVDDLGQTSCGTGACARTVDNCVAGSPQTCVPGTAAPETCNLADDDCNGSVDEGLGETTCGQGSCQRTTANCIDGIPRTCIPGAPSGEACNLADDDCNGVVDDLAPTTCGTGACARTVTTCVDGTLQSCTPGSPSTEVCNQIDDDCNGQTDELGQTSCGVGACARTVDNCQGGVPQSCVPGTPVAESCNLADDDCDGSTDEELGQTTCGVGACERTVVNCVAGAPQSCVAGTPTPEACNLIDDDCDGAVDDFAPVTCGVGACQRTVETCIAGVPQTCSPGDPAAESCNLIDDDCNGAVDDLGQTVCGVGRCQVTVQNCVNGVSQSCTPYDPLDEKCNGLDDDCDGTVDEGFGEATCGVGACQRTVALCSGGVPHSCVPGPPTAEICNSADDDCDGSVDEGFGEASCGVGACARTVTECVAGVPQSCVPGTPVAETCNLTDDDCNGAVDDLPSISCGVGACQRIVAACANGQPQSCEPGVPGVESCNGLDDDCDGSVDEEFGQTTCGVGACQRTIDNCSGGSPQSCVPGTPVAELCNGIDDNCDTAIDDGFGQTTCGIGPCQRTVSDCVAGVPQTCVPGTPSPELCNGEDDDCDGLADNVPVLAVSGLRWESDDTSLVWAVDPAATSFDVVKGGLAALRAGAGDFTGSLLECLAAATGTPAASDLALPDVGSPFYYLVRATNCAGAAGTYDTSSPRQHASRDPGIAASPAACP